MIIYEKIQIESLGFLQNLIKTTFQAALNLFDSSKEEKQERLGPFFVRDVKDHKIQLKLSKSISSIVTTDDNGRFHEKIIVNSLEGLNINRQVLKYLASDDDYHEQGDEGFIYLMKKKTNGGCSIISDIDDTIKISEVPNKKKLMVNTFKKDFKAVPGRIFDFEITTLNAF
jgi:phosphatidate phosphatase APP1